MLVMMDTMALAADGAVEALADLIPVMAAVLVGMGDT